MSFLVNNQTCVPKRITDARIISIDQVKPEHFRVKLHCPYIALNSKPGQFIHVQVSNSYDPLLSRPLAVFRSQGEEFEILFRVVGKGTKILAEKCVGDNLLIVGPLGKCFPVDKKCQKAIIVSGGMGIAALMSLIEGMTDQDIHVLLGVATEKQLIGEDDLNDLGVKIHIATDDGSRGYKGFVSELLLKLINDGIISTEQNCIFACGPIPMLKSVAYIGQEKGIQTYVSLEERMACGIGACMGCACRVVSSGNKLEYKMVCKDGPVFNARELIWD
ncbi:dihydroorotate dehydrogenase electron transfer subunit [Candidatus Poribacteria bacterium]|nr:dihydroorotate dehydrogenase electron transfer subunit [Candidatus Poribacteria bacterium]